LPRGHATVELKPAAASSAWVLQATLTDGGDIEWGAGRCRELLDLDCDPGPIAHALAADRPLPGLIARRPGIRVPGCADGFELAVRAVIGQQISVAAARRLAGRLVSSWGERIPTANEYLTHLFPTPAALAEVPLESAGLTKRQAGTIRALARAVAAGELSIETSAGRGKERERLLAMPGVGRWHAPLLGMQVMRLPGP